MHSGMHAAGLPLASCSGALALVFLVVVEPIRIAFLPMAITSPC